MVIHCTYHFFYSAFPTCQVPFSLLERVGQVSARAHVADCQIFPLGPCPDGATCDANTVGHYQRYSHAAPPRHWVVEEGGEAVHRVGQEVWGQQVSSQHYTNQVGQKIYCRFSLSYLVTSENVLCLYVMYNITPIHK